MCDYAWATDEYSDGLYGSHSPDVLAVHVGGESCAPKCVEVVMPRGCETGSTHMYVYSCRTVVSIYSGDVEWVRVESSKAAFAGACECAFGVWLW